MAIAAEVDANGGFLAEKLSQKVCALASHGGRYRGGRRADKRNGVGHVGYDDAACHLALNFFVERGDKPQYRRNGDENQKNSDLVIKYPSRNPVPDFFIDFFRFIFVHYE